MSGDFTAEGFIDHPDARWTFAKTMADMPHEYVVRGKTAPPDDWFDWFVLLIREHGFKRTFGRRHYLYLRVGDHRYWTMGAPLAKTIIINRAKAHPDDPIYC